MRAKAVSTLFRVVQLESHWVVFEGRTTHNNACACSYYMSWGIDTLLVEGHCCGGIAKQANMRVVAAGDSSGVGGSHDNSIRAQGKQTLVYPSTAMYVRHIPLL